MTIEQSETEVIVTLDSNPETSLKIINHGATVVSWKVNGKEQLWLSEKAVLDGSKAVRGGIPLVFPVFGKASEGPCSSLPQHGFARNSNWEFLGQTSESPITIQFALSPDQISEDSKTQWSNNDFTLIYSLTLDEKLIKTEITIENNNNDKDFDFKWLFHTYFRIPEIESISVKNIKDVLFYDQLIKEDTTQSLDELKFSKETDAIYKDFNSDIIINDNKSSNDSPLFTIKRNGLNDAVIWNPWTEKAAGMGDFYPKDGFHQMVCVEAGSVSKWTTLKAGGKWTASQTIISHQE